MPLIRLQLCALFPSRTNTPQGCTHDIQESAKEIDHRNIAAMFIAQDTKSTQMAIDSMNEVLLARKFILPIETGSLSTVLSMGFPNGTAE
jgi:hypothetical protein